MKRLFADFFRYSFHPTQSSNKREQILQFMFKDYPAYLWGKPSLLRILAFPVLLIAVVFTDYTV